MYPLRESGDARSLSSALFASFAAVPVRTTTKDAKGTKEENGSEPR